MQIGAGIYGTFGVIFFYEKFGNSIEKVLVLFALLYAIFIVVTHLGAKLISRLGMKKMMVFAVFFSTSSIVARYMWDSDPTFYLVIFFVAFALFKMLYWVPYHVEFTAFTDKEMRGKQMALLGNVSKIFTAVLPLVGGFILTVSNYNTLFLTSAIVISLSVIPLFYIKETKEEYEWSTTHLIREFFDKANRPIVLSEFGNGIQDAVGSVIWPVFIFILLKGDYFSVGLVSSLTIVVLMILSLVIGSFIDKLGRKKVLKIGSILYTTGWLFKIFVETSFGIFLVDTYHSFGRVINKLPFDATAYDHAEENERFVDEFTVLKEISLILGKMVMFVMSIFIIGIFGITATFIFAALATLSMTLISKSVHVD